MSKEPPGDNRPPSRRSASSVGLAQRPASQSNASTTWFRPRRTLRRPNPLLPAANGETIPQRTQGRPRPRRGRRRNDSNGELAQETGIEPRSLAKTITDLRRRGWIVRRTGLLADLADKRRSYYQLAEPLARLAFQLKEARGRPVDSSSNSSRPGSTTRASSPKSAEATWPLGTGKPPTSRSSPTRHSRSPKHLAAKAHRTPWPGSSTPPRDLFHPDPKAAINQIAARMLLDVDDAVAAYQAGDAEPLLRQPPEISDLVERQLADMTPSRQRLSMARLALNGQMESRWVRRLEQLCSQTTGSENAETKVLLALHQLRRSRTGPADILLAEVASPSSEADTSMLLSGRIAPSRRAGPDTSSNPPQSSAIEDLR